MEHSSTTKYFILSELGKKELRGYELIAHLEKIFGKKPSASQVYPVLKDLKKKGYVTAKTVMIGKKKTFSYKLTVEGKKLFSSMNKRFEVMVNSFLQEKIKICAHCDCEMLKGAVSKKIKGKLLYFCCHSCLAAYEKN